MTGPHKRRVWPRKTLHPSLSIGVWTNVLCALPVSHSTSL